MTVSILPPSDRMYLIGREYDYAPLCGSPGCRVRHAIVVDLGGKAVAACGYCLHKLRKQSKRQVPVGESA